MLKLTFCLRRLPHLTREEFQSYWLEKHGPLVRLHAADLGLLRYVQGHAVADERGRVLAAARGAPEPFDGVAELYWSSEIEFERCLATPEARRAGRILLEDERRFIDLACSPIFFSREHQLVP